MSSRDLFGTDGIRGLAGKYPLNDEGAEQVGRAVGLHFAKPGQQVVLGRDPRESSEAIAAAITKGLTTVGVNVTQVGVLPTPGLAYLTREGDFSAGVMVTASHNPYQYNGIKVFDQRGDKLSDETEVTLNRLIVSSIPAATKPGTATSNAKLVKHYEDFLVGSAKGLQLDKISIAIDMANGAATGLAERVFVRLGAKVTPIADRPDGRNINDGCGATHPQGLAREVTAKKLKLGIALDGDADRLVMIDERGREVKGDYLMYILAVNDHLKGVVVTVMSNLGFEASLKRKGIKVERVKVGDRYVLEGLAHTGYHLGGEQSGHIILPDLLKTGDGVLAAVQVVRAMHDSDRSLADWCDEVQLLPQAIVNIPISNRAALERQEVQAFIRQQTEQLGSRGRLLIRPSGTEPLARIMVEAPNAEQQAESIAKTLEELVK